MKYNSGIATHAHALEWHAGNQVLIILVNCSEANFLFYSWMTYVSCQKEIAEERGKKPKWDVLESVCTQNYFTLSLKLQCSNLFHLIVVLYYIKYFLKIAHFLLNCVCGFRTCTILKGKKVHSASRSLVLFFLSQHLKWCSKVHFGKCFELASQSAFWHHEEKVNVSQMKASWMTRSSHSSFAPDLSLNCLKIFGFSLGLKHHWVLCLLVRVSI